MAAILAFGAWPSGGEAVSIFGVQRRPGEAPGAIDFDDIWFYEEDRSRQIPDINLKWIAAAFDESTLVRDPGSFEPAWDPKAVLLERAREIAREHEQIVDVYYDENLAEDACFFNLRDGLGEGAVKDLIRALQTTESIAYVHPTLILQGKTVAYFNAFQMNWKTSVDDASRKALMEQAHVSVEHPGEVYRVDVLAIPFFKAINLLAEDVRVLDVTPTFVTLAPTIRVGLSVPLEGCQIGDRIPFALRVDFSDRIRIDPSSLVNINLRPGQIQKELFDLKFDPYDYVQAVSQSPFVLTGWMKIYSPGEFVIPAVEIRYECIPCSDDRVRSIKTEAVPLKVASIVPSKLESPGLAVPMDNVKPVLPVGSPSKASEERSLASDCLLRPGSGPGGMVGLEMGCRGEREGRGRRGEARRRAGGASPGLFDPTAHGSPLGICRRCGKAASRVSGREVWVGDGPPAGERGGVFRHGQGTGAGSGRFPSRASARGNRSHDCPGGRPVP